MSASTDALVAAKEALTTGLAQHGEAAIALIDAALAENDEDTSAPLAELLGPAKKDPAVEEEAEEAEAEIEPEAVEPEAEAGAGDASVEPQADDGQTSESPAAESAESSDDGFNAS